jgi:RNA polymerase sigma factor (sigma-70 family)
VSDEELAQEAKSGNKAAVELLFRSTYRDVFVFIHWKTRDYHLAWDLAQETFLKMMRVLNTYNPSAGSFKPWLMRIAVNTVNDYYRSRSFHKKELEETLDPEQYTSGDLLDKILISEQTKQLMRSVNRLPGPQRDAILLKFIHGLKFREIGTVLNISEATAKSRVRLGLIKLKENLAGGGKYGQPYSEIKRKKPREG